MITRDTISSDIIEILAPRELVWGVLIDFDNYEAWNKFCPRCEAELVVGSPIKMQVDLGFGLQEQIEEICLIQPPQAVAWKMDTQPEDPIHATRTQYLQEIDANRCSYQSIDVFAGPALDALMESMAKAIEDGFNLCGYGLKAYCERVQRS